MPDHADGPGPLPDSTASLDAPSLRAPRHIKVSVRSVSLLVLAVLATLFTLRWARDVLVPIVLGVMLSHSLSPIVDRLQRWRIPRAAASALLLAAIAAAIGWGSWSLSDEGAAGVETLPRVSERIRELSERGSGSLSVITKVERAASEIASAATAGASAASAAEGASSPASVPGRKASPKRNAAPANAPAPEAARKPTIDVRAFLLSGTLSALAFLGQAAIVFLIALFLLASGHSFRRKMVKLAGPRFSRKKVTIETLDEITAQIQRYLVVQLGTSVLLGLLTGLAFHALGLQQAALWGVLAGATNLIPYLGALLVGVGAAVVALVQFGTLEMALLASAASFGIHFIVGSLLMPWWTGRAGRISPFAVFVTVLVFGWLWGVWGLFLGVPVLMVVKAVCDRVDDLKPVGELLGE